MQFAAAINSGDTGWVLVASALVLLMAIPGLAHYYSGRVRAEAMPAVALQCLAVAGGVSLLWVTVGYSLAFAEGGALLGGTGNLLLADLADVLEPFAIPESAFALFQMTSAILAATLIVGAVAGRARFGWMLGFALLWTLLVYVPVAHWIWGGGWLAELGALDFAGGIVVHIAAGVSALVAAWMIGARRGLPEAQVADTNPALVMTGAGLIWIGWFGLTGGSAFAASDAAAIALLNTQLAAAAGALTGLGVERLRYGKVSATGLVAGAIAGLATVTAAAGFVGPLGAIALGGIGALLGFAATLLVKPRLKIDDSLDVFAVHGVGGIAGALLLPLLISETLGGGGFPEGATLASQTIAQAVAVGAVVLWAAIGTLVAGYMVAVLIPMRVSEPAKQSLNPRSKSDRPAASP